MRLLRLSRSERERFAADLATAQARSHLQVLVNELRATLERVEDKRKRIQDAR